MCLQILKGLPQNTVHFWKCYWNSHDLRLAPVQPQALTAKTLLARAGQPAALRIGVAKKPDGHLEAHAWLESEGRIVVGHLRDLSRFSPLPPLPGELL